MNQEEMDMSKIIGNLLNAFAPLILVIFGIAFIVGGVIGMRQADSFTPTTGTIKSIEVTPGVGDESDTYTVIVEYTVDGTTYYSDLGQLNSGDHEGKVIDILYDPDHPEHIIQPGKKGAMIAIGLGVVVLLTGIGTGIRQILFGR